MDRPENKGRRLFNREVFQTSAFTERAAPLDKGTVALIVEVTATHYPLFRRLRHGLVLGQLSEGLPPGYGGPGLEFLYFICLRVGGFDQAELADIEAAYGL
jgi:hypothetical protein